MRVASTSTMLSAVLKIPSILYRFSSTFSFMTSFRQRRRWGVTVTKQRLSTSRGMFETSIFCCSAQPLLCSRCAASDEEPAKKRPFGRLQTTAEFINSRGIIKCYAPSFFIPLVLVPAFRPCRQEAFCLLPGMLEILMFSGRTRTPTGSFGGSSVGKHVLYDPTAASFQLEMKIYVWRPFLRMVCTLA